MDRHGPADLFWTAAETRSDMTQVCLAGALDYQTAEDLRSSLDRLMADGQTRIMLELSRLDFCDAAGVRYLDALRESAQQAGGELVLERPAGSVKRIFELTRLGDAVTIR